MGQAIHSQDDERDVLFVNELLEHVIENRVSEVQAANVELAEAKVRLREVSERLISAQEEERRRISRELQDETGKAVAGLKVRLHDALSSEGRRVARIRECLAIVEHVVLRIRALAPNLHPPGLED